jgi:DNA (cytosine-5)-methyltransferase 1
MKAIDLFAGVGGWNLALSALDIPVVLAANHSVESLETYRLNFPHIQRATVDIMTCDTDLIPDVEILTASPECTYHSTSSGVQLRQQRQLRLWTDRAEAPFVKRSRETMYGVARWAQAKVQQGRPIPLIFVENVTDLRLWGGLADWYTSMERLGYQHHTLSFNSCFARPLPAAVPQSRDRCYIVLWRRGLPAPDLDLRPAASCPRCSQPVKAVQCWRGSERRFGDYGQQYEYHCPRCDALVVPDYTPVECVLEWSIPILPIGARKKPLCPQTLANIEQGLRWYVRHPRRAGERQAFLLSYYGHAVFRRPSDVAGTVTTRDRHCLIALPDDWTGGAPPDVRCCGYRMCTLSEYQAMMGIPPSFRFACSKTAALKQLGLAVTPAAALEVLARGLSALGSTRHWQEAEVSA